MSEGELFALLEHTAEAAYAVTEEGTIRSWNPAARQLFGYAPADAMARNIDELLDARDHLGTHPLAGGLEAATRRWPLSGHGIPAFDLEVRTARGERIWVSVATILYEGGRPRRRLFVRLAHDITARRQRAELAARVLGAARDLAALAEEDASLPPVEPLTRQELRVLRGLANGGTPAAIARALHISPQTLRNHLHHINRKLRTHTRLEAVVHARRHGLLR
jgi:PAS domain S-box-containing protein